MKVHFNIETRKIDGVGNIANYDRAITKQVEIGKAVIPEDAETVDDIPGFADFEQYYDGVMNAFGLLVIELNEKYPGMNVDIDDTEKEAGEKMISAGVTFDDVAKYGSCLKFLKDLI